MAHTRSAGKRVRQNAIRRARNKAKRSSLRTQLRKTVAAVAAGSAEAAQAEFKKATKSLDTAAGHGLIHKNQAARRKSRLTRKLAALKQPGEKPPAT